MELCFLWFFVQEPPKAQPAVVLVLKRLRRRGNGLKFHPTDWEKPGIEPATPGLQGKKKFCGFSMGRNQYWAGRVYDLCVYYMTGTPEGSTESGFMENPGIEPATPGLQGIALIHYTTGASLNIAALKIFCGFPGYTPVPPGWFMIVCWFSMSGIPKGSPKVFLWRSRESNLRPLVYKA